MKCKPITSGEWKGWIYIENEPIPEKGVFMDWTCQKCGHEDDGAPPSFIKYCPVCNKLSQGSRYTGYFMPYTGYLKAFKEFRKRNWPDMSNKDIDKEIEEYNNVGNDK